MNQMDFFCQDEVDAFDGLVSDQDVASERSSFD